MKKWELPIWWIDYSYCTELEFSSFPSDRLTAIYTEMRLASFLSVVFTTMAVINSPERKLPKRTCVKRLSGLPTQTVPNKMLIRPSKMLF